MHQLASIACLSSWRSLTEECLYPTVLEANDSHGGLMKLTNGSSPSPNSLSQAACASMF